MGMLKFRKSVTPLLHLRRFISFSFTPLALESVSCVSGEILFPSFFFTLTYATGNEERPREKSICVATDAQKFSCSKRDPVWKWSSPQIRLSMRAYRLSQITYSSYFFFLFIHSSVFPPSRCYCSCDRLSGLLCLFPSFSDPKSRFSR